VALPPSSDLSPWITRLPAGSRVDVSPSSRHKGAVALSLACAAIWPICLIVPIIIMQVSNSPQYPGWVGALTGLGLLFTPIIGIISGLVGLYRSLRAPALRGSWWRAVAGLVLGCIWLAGTFVL
jgi:hypothetical protein